MVIRNLLRQAGRILLPVAIVALGGAGMLLLGKHEQAERAPEDDNAVTPVLVESVEPYTGTVPIRVDGVVVPYREIELAAEVGGRIQRKDPQCEAGRFVTQGTELIQIDPRDYELEVRRLENTVQQAEVELAELEQEEDNTARLLELVDREVELMERDLQRARSLGGRGVSTEAEVDKAEQAVLAAQNSKTSLENQLQLLEKRRDRLLSGRALAQAQLDKALLDVQRTTIVAPVDGVIVRDVVEEGSFVQPGGTLLVIEDTSRVEVRCSLTMDDLYWIWDQADESLEPAQVARGGYELPPTEVEIVYRLAGRPQVEYVWTGTLDRFDGIGVDPQTRTAACLITVYDPQAVRVQYSGSARTAASASGPPALVRGMFVAVRIDTRPPSRLVRVDHNALRPGKTLWRVRDGQLDVLRNVQAVKQITEWDEEGQRSFWLIEAGEEELAPTDHVVISPLSEVYDGMPVVPTYGTGRTIAQN